MEKMCPLIAITAKQEPPYCLKNACQWWAEANQCCAILDIADYLGQFANFGIAIDKREE